MSSITRVSPVRRLSSPVRNRLKAAVSRVAQRQVAAEFARRGATIDQVIADFRKEFGAVSDSVLGQVGDVRSVLDAVKRDRDIENARLADALAEVAAARRSLDEHAKRQEESADTQRSLEDCVREMGTRTDTFGFSLEMLHGPTGRFLSRLVSEDEINELIASFDFVEETDRVPVAVHQAYRTLAELELRCVGRLAGSTPNILAKLAAVTLLPIPSPEVLEIGTLFGIGAVGVARQLARIDADAFLTVVDPFAGYQIQPDRGVDEDVSLTPATQTVVATNLALGGVGVDRYRLVVGRSPDSDVLQALGDRRYGLIIIDGDHSTEAALNDLILAESLAEPGALVILDDYDDPAWPGVADALAEYENRTESKLRRIGVASTSAFLRAG